MSYRITYGPEPKIAKRKVHTFPRIRIITAAFLLIFSIVVKTYWPEGHAKLAQILLPEKYNVTQSALETMVNDLGNGETLSDAVTAFCRQILDHAKENG